MISTPALLGSLRNPLLWIALLFLAAITSMPLLGPLFAAAFPAIEPPVYAGESFLGLWLSHALLVAESSLASAVIGIAAGIFATRSAGYAFRPMLETLATIGQSFPPVALLAIAVPTLGYGAAPTFVALTIYGILPILKNTIAGLADVPRPISEGAIALGMRPGQVLRQVELRLAAPAILAGIRTSVIINIGTATIGSTIGAVTLGNPIIGGLVADKVSYVIQGAIVVGLFAILTDLAFEQLDQRLRRFMQVTER